VRGGGNDDGVDDDDDDDDDALVLLELPRLAADRLILVDGWKSHG